MNRNFSENKSTKSKKEWKDVVIVNDSHGYIKSDYFSPDVSEKNERKKGRKKTVETFFFLLVFNRRH
jgi:hypothetical protein